MAHLKVITGPMFSGKTEELIRLLRLSDYASKRISVVKPKIDVRSKEEIVSRRNSGGQSLDFAPAKSWPATSVDSVEELREIINREQPEILALDEAQFFGEWIFDFLVELMREQRSTKLKVIVAGLDMDAWGRPFGLMPQFMAIANEVIKTTAVCFKCKEEGAMLTQKLVASSQQIEVGDKETYEARCRVCHDVPGSA